MSNKVTPLKSKIISLVPYLRRKHPAWCDQDGCEKVHSGLDRSGRSWHLHTNGRPEFSWQLSAVETRDGSEPRLSAALFMSNEGKADQGAFLLCTIGDARAFAEDLLEIADAVDAVDGMKVRSVR